MNALTIQSRTAFTQASAGGASNEMRDLTSREVDEVAGSGPTLTAITGIFLLGIICMDYGQEISDASVRLAEWLRGSD